MGRLPKGFKHGKISKEDATHGEQQEEAQHKPHDHVHGANPSQFLKSTAPDLPANDSDEEEDGSEGPETRGKMIQRHKKVCTANPTCMGTPACLQHRHLAEDGCSGTPA